MTEGSQRPVCWKQAKKRKNLLRRWAPAGGANSQERRSKQKLARLLRSIGAKIFESVPIPQSRAANGSNAGLRSLVGLNDGNYTKKSRLERRTVTCVGRVNLATRNCQVDEWSRRPSERPSTGKIRYFDPPTLLRLDCDPGLRQASRHPCSFRILMPLFFNPIVCC
ncbi:hypothetical protein M3Y99_00860900 [Aphelenchoides fujianensis]|nr:hypothetical protein M3Y99_00860900 [Aphelenchoides fujianensis]